MYLTLSLDLPPLAFLGMFCMVALVNGAAWLHRVPLFLSSDRAAEMVHALLPQRSGCSLIDLGCGTGTLLSKLARYRPDARFLGIELAPLPFLCSRLRAVRQPAVAVRWGSFWRTNLGNYDVVYAYLSPAPMSRLWEKARREMRPGSLLISNGFGIKGVEPAEVIELRDAVQSRLYVWRM